MLPDWHGSSATSAQILSNATPRCVVVTRPPLRWLVTLAVDAVEADATGYEPIYPDGQLVGFVTAGGYGHRIGRSPAIGYVKSALPADQEGLTVAVLGERCPCRILRQPSIDPAGMRACSQKLTADAFHELA